MERINLQAALKKGIETSTESFSEKDRKVGGRPKKTDDEKTSKNKYTIYFSDDEKVQVEEAAKREFMTLQAFVRSAALKAATV